MRFTRYVLGKVNVGLTRAQAQRGWLFLWPYDVAYFRFHFPSFSFPFPVLFFFVFLFSFFGSFIH